MTRLQKVFFWLLQALAACCFIPLKGDTESIFTIFWRSYPFLVVLSGWIWAILIHETLLVSVPAATQVEDEEEDEEHED